MRVTPDTNLHNTKDTAPRCISSVFNSMGLVQSIGAVFSRLSRCFCRSSNRSGKGAEHPGHRLGREGEKLAARYLKRNGFKVLYRNFRGPKGGEVDIVCRDKSCGMLVFVEVKTRSSAEIANPADAVTAEKEELMNRGADAWLRMLGHPDIKYRFDIVEVVMRDGTAQFNVIRNALAWSEGPRRS